MMRTAWTIVLVLVSANALAFHRAPGGAEPNAPNSAPPASDAAAAPDAPGEAATTDDTNALIASPAIEASGQVEDPRWSAASSAWGSRGLYRVDAARWVKPGSLIFTLRSELAYGTGLFQSGDSDLYSAERLYVLWSPVRGLDLALSEVLKINTWTTFVPAKLQVLGLQRLNVKYTREIQPGLGVGGRLQWQLPTAVYSAGVVPKASVVQLDALASWLLPHHIELSANVGYVLDLSKNLAGLDLQPDKRFVYEVNDGGALALGVGAGMDVDVRHNIMVSPFVEVSGRINTLPNFATNPVVASLGARVFGTDTHVVEGALGVDVRILGAPKAGFGFAGVPLWTGFAVLSLHIFDHPPPQTYAAVPCDTNEDCPGGQLCVENLCRYTTEVIKETIKRVKQDTFTVAGSVLDGETGRPVEEAAVVFHGFEHSPVQVNVTTGRFASFPLDSGEGLLEVKVTAPGYKPYKAALQRGQPNQVVYTDVKLNRSDRPDFGIVQGVVLDSKSGMALHDAKIFIPALQQTIGAGARGRFEGKIKVGKYDILVSAKGYVTQRKHIVVHDGDTLILNIDLARDARHYKNGR